ncbi:MAG: sterol desaturase family protein, partial [Oleispira sp.]|nr:sterol desaturase family protein [Oleispira sp.]
MEDVLHAILFVILAGGFFVSLMIIEAYYCYRQGQSDIYDFKETVVNLTTGAMYKITDG